MRTRLVMSLATCCLLVGLAGCGSGTSPEPTSAASVAASSTPASSSVGTTTATSPTSTARSSATASGASTASSSGASGADSAAADYCVQQGGEVQTRSAYFGTNGDQSNWLPLGETTSMCRFQADDEAKSRIYVDLTTLSSTEPTLAALAYLSKVPMPPSAGGANPASGYCTKELSGSSTFGAISAAGGGWVAKGDPDDVVVNLCVFPDLSFIDEWGLAYHSAGAIRGADLATAMKYQPGTDLPPVFPSGTATPTS